MSKLRVRKFVNRSRAVHGEVPPHTGSRSEIQFLNPSGSGLEASFGIFGSDTNSNTVAVGFHARFRCKVDVRRGTFFKALTSIELSNFRNVFQGNAHGYLELCGRQVDFRNHFCHGVLHLETRIQFQKVKLLVCFVVQVFHCSCVRILNRFGQSHSGLFHLLPDCWLGCHRRSFLDNLLMSSLHGTVATIESNGISVLIGNELDFQVTSILRQFHDKNGAPRHFSTYLAIGIGHLVGLIDASNPLASSTFGCLDHDGESEFDGTFFRLRRCGNSSFFIDLFGETSHIWIVRCFNVGAIPSNAGNSCRLCNDGGSDFISQRSHGRSLWSNEFDGRIGLCKSFRECGIFTGVSPSSPDGVDTMQACQFDNEGNIGIVMIVGATRNVHDDITDANILCVGSVEQEEK